MVTKEDGVGAARGQRKHASGEEAGSSRSLHELRLVSLLNELTRRHGLIGAAAELGVGYQTLRRCRIAGRLSNTLRLALERYLLEGPGAPSSPWWRRFEELAVRVQDVEGNRDQAAGRLASVERELRQLREQVHERGAELERRVRRLLEERLQQISWFNRQDTRVANGGAGVPAGEVALPFVRRGRREPAGRAWGNTAGGDELRAPESLVQAWQEARGACERARTRLEEARAAERLLELELALIQKHGESVPPGEGWDAAKRSRELAWRWDALEDRRKERRRLELRRLVRRILTLGLWWS